MPYVDPTLIDDTYGIKLSPHGIVHMMNAATQAGTGIVEVHSHPGADESVRFSRTDEEGHCEIVHFALSSLRNGSPYGSMVAGRRSLSGLLWLAPSSQPLSIATFRVAGRPAPLFAELGDPRLAFDEGRYTRQVALLGREGQRKIGLVKVGIVGLGGTGSIVARTLAYEGVRSFVLVDHDNVTKSNLNRMDGATRWDARLHRKKVKVARREIRRIAPDSRITSVPRSLFSREAIEMLAESDIIFGCTHNHGTRLCLNEISAAYLKPYIDLGSGIVAEDGVIREAGGRVTVVLPGEGCLLCACAVNPQVAGHELARTELREFAMEQGYVEGEDVPSPSVMSLNQTIAALAATEFKAVVAQLREPIRQVHYDLLRGTVSPVTFRARNKCLVCHGYVGKGDLLEIRQRYGKG